MESTTASSLHLDGPTLNPGVDSNSDCFRAPVPTLMSIAAACIGGGGAARSESGDMLAASRCRETSESKGSFETLTGMNGIEEAPGEGVIEAG